LTSALAVYVGLLNLSGRISWKLPADGVEWRQVEGQGVVAERLIRPVQASGVQPGDKLLEINDIVIRNIDDYHNVLELLSGPPFAGTPTRYTIERGDTRFVIPVDIKAQSQIGFTDYLLIAVAFTYLATGLFIYLRNGQAAGAFHFYLLCLVAFILFLYRHSGIATPFDVLIYWCSAAAFLLLPPLFLHFCCYFPEPIAAVKKSKFAKPAIYFPALILAVVHLAWFTKRLTVFGLPRNYDTQLLVDRVHLLHFIVYFVAAGLVLTFLRKGCSPVQRQQMKWLVYGTIAGTFPFVVLYGIPYLIGARILDFMSASVLGLGLIPVSFGYAITRFRLMDVDLIAKRGASYVLASSALLGLYMLVALLLGRAAATLSPESGFFLFAVCALLVALLFAPIKNRIQEQIDRFFYKEGYDYRQSMSEFGRTLTSEIDLGRLVEKICNRISVSLDLPNVQVYLRDQVTPQRFRRIGPEGHSNVQTVLHVPDCAFVDFDRELNPVFVCPPNEAINELRRELEALRLHYVQPMRVHGRVLGFIAFGAKSDGHPLSTEDLDLVAGLANYAAIAIDNALLYRSLQAKATELEHLKQYSENVIESLVAGVAVVNPEGEITVWNNALEAMTGIKREKAVGQKLSDVLQADLVRAVRSVLGSDWTTYETAHLRKISMVARDQSTRLVNISLAPFFLAEGINTGTLLLFDDVTEKVRLENQLLQAEKLSSIGLFAAGVAHEVNTPLAGISSYAQMLLKEAEEGSSQQELLKKIEHQSFRASNIINNLLRFARVSDAELQTVNVNSLMVEALSLVEHQFKKNRIDVNLDLDPALPTTLGNSGRLQQVFMNLFLNAKDAMPDGGQLTVRSYRQDSRLVIEVHDTGQGIAPEDVKRIYDPFFTTKDVGKGTGLGLSVSYGIIQEHSGQISVESQPGKGTTFTLQLPLRRVN